MRTYKIIAAVANDRYAYFTGQIIDETPHNIDDLEDIYRGGLAERIDEEAKKKGEAPGRVEQPIENPDVLHDVPSAPAKSVQPRKPKGR